MAIKNKRLKLFRGSTYTFDVSDPALANNPLKFTADSGTTEYTTGITLTGTQGQSGASIQFVVDSSAPNNLNYYGDSTSLKMGNHILIPGSAPTTPASPDYTDSALSQSFFLNAIDAYDSDTNSYSTDNTYMGGDFNDPERIATNGTYTLLGDPGVLVKHTGTGTTGTDTPVAQGGWTWLIRNRDGALIKSWNGMMNGDTVNINTLDLENYNIGGTQYYSKFHTCNWGSNVSITKKYMFIGVQYRPTGGGNSSLNWSDRRAYISVYELTNFTHVHTFALEDFYGSSYIEAYSGAPGYSGGGTGWSESLWYSDDENLFVGASHAAAPYNTNYPEGAVTWWDLSDPDPANWSTNPDAVIRNPINIVNDPTTNIGGTNYSNGYFGQYVNYRNNNLVVGNSVWLHKYSKSGSTFTRDNYLVLNSSEVYASPGTSFMSTDDTNIVISRTNTNPRSFVARDYTNNFSESWSYSNTNGGFPYSGFRQLNAGKDVKVEIAVYPDYFANNKAGAVSFIKTSDRTSVLELDNPFVRDSDGLYFGQGLGIAPIDSEGSNRFSMVSWGEPDDNDTKDIISFWELIWDSASGTLALDDPPPFPGAWAGPRALIIGVNQGSTSGGAEYFDITTLGNSSAFGDLSHYRRHGAAVSNKTRILYASGSVSAGPTNTIDYYTSATPGTAIDFGDVTGISGTNTDPDAGYVGRTGLTGVSNGTYGIFMGGQIQSGYGSNVIDRVTIMTPGNATDIGDLTQSVVRYSTSTNDDTRGLNIGGYTQNTFLSNMDYITMANTGNASSFGTLSQNVSNGTRGNVGNNTIGVFGGGYKDSNWYHQTLLQQVTIQTTANSTSFGNLNTYSNSNISATTDGSRAVFTGYGNYTDIKYLELNTGGTTSDFGDLINQLNGRSGASGNAA